MGSTIFSLVRGHDRGSLVLVDVVIPGLVVTEGLAVIIDGVLPGGWVPAVEAHVARMKVLDLAPLLIASIETGFDDVFIDPLHRQSPHGLARESEVGGMTGVARVLFQSLPPSSRIRSVSTCSASSTQERP